MKSCEKVVGYLLGQTLKYVGSESRKMKHHFRESRMQEPREFLGNFFPRCLSVALLQQ